MIPRFIDFFDGRELGIRTHRNMDRIRGEWRDAGDVESDAVEWKRVQILYLDWSR